MNVLLFIFAVIGMTHIVIDSEIMGPVDERAKKWLPAKVYHGLFECYQCSGFWCGLVLGIFTVSFNPFVFFACGCAGSFLADLGKFLLDALEAYLDRKAE